MGDIADTGGMKWMRIGVAVLVMVFAVAACGGDDGAAPAATEPPADTTTTTTSEAPRDWLAEFRDSFVDESLAAKASAVTRIEHRGAWLHVHVQDTDPELLGWACTYTSLLFRENVQVYRAGDVAADRCMNRG